MSPLEIVRSYLQEREPSLNIIELDSTTATAPLAAAALGTSVGSIAKSILFKGKDDRYLMIVSAGDVRLESKAIKELAGCRVRMATADEVTAITGFSIGGVCPFALKPGQVEVFLDASLKDYDIVYAAAGSANSALPITYEQLQRVTGGQPCNCSNRQV